MAAHGLSFESSSNIEERKNSKRHARQEAIEKAKQQYEKDERRKELKRQRGEDTWMLPEINQRLQEIEEEGSVKSKKKKEKKSKKKKEKKKKAKKEKKTAEDGSDSSEVSFKTLIKQNLYYTGMRDEWMTFDFLAMRTTSTSEKRAEKERLKEEERAKAEAIEQAGLHKLELNPYWKDGGTGLPPEKMAGPAAKKGGPVVNDAGLGWLRKSYQRMQEQAERQQRSLNDVVAERYGSMEEFQQRLADAEKAVYGQSRGGKGDRTARGGWKRGEDEARERWRRKDGDGAERDRWRRNERERDSSPTDRERYHAGRGEDRERGGYRGREEDRGRDRLREKERERDRDGDRFREKERERARDGDRDREKYGGRDRERARGGDRERDNERDGDGDRDRERERDSERIRESAATSSGQNWSQHSPSLGSLKSRFLKPSEDDSGEGGLMSRPFVVDVSSFAHVTGHSSEDQEILLFRTDQSGRAWPVSAPSGPQEPHGGRRKKKAIETHVDGERVRYFQDDDNVGLKEMVRREKMSSAQDQNALYSRMAAKVRKRYSFNRYLSKVPYHYCMCLPSCIQVYLSLPAGVSMTEGHCHICPLQHHCSATGLDEDVWSEMQLFRRTLVRMFESQELDCVFMETHMNPRKRHHLVLECIPLPRELGDMAPIYFKKAIMECDEEWAMNKKVVDLSSKDIRHAVPRGLPYFAVDFGLQGGFAHVIENEQKFPHYFGKEVVGGMMDLEPRRWRKSIRENFDDQRKKVLQFAQWWKPYDCTKTEG
uniref:CWF19 like cell cycle control factor 2 n=1 Tax=Sander lucioperca TaxID=283035 RepID=A0A8C9YHJ8_SANLU